MGRKTEDIKERFLRDTADHELSILHESGVYRHLRLHRNHSSCYHYDIVTYPGYLVMSGDMGCWVFSRTNDMFTFFRGHKDKWEINPHYWEEKIQSGGNRRGDSSQEYDEDYARETIEDIFNNWKADHALSENELEEGEDLDDSDLYDEDTVDELWDCIEDEVLCAETEEQMHHKAAEFRHSDTGFEFSDFWEYNLRTYTHHYIWACYAIVKAIKMYDASMAETVKDMLEETA